MAGLSSAFDSSHASDVRTRLEAAKAEFLMACRSGNVQAVSSLSTLRHEPCTILLTILVCDDNVPTIAAKAVLQQAVSLMMDSNEASEASKKVHPVSYKPMAAGHFVLSD